MKLEIALVGDGSDLGVAVAGVSGSECISGSVTLEI